MIVQESGFVDWSRRFKEAWRDLVLDVYPTEEGPRGNRGVLLFTVHT